MYAGPDLDQLRLGISEIIHGLWGGSSIGFKMRNLAIPPSSISKLSHHVKANS